MSEAVRTTSKPRPPHAILRWFRAGAHITGPLKDVSSRCEKLALEIDALVADSAEKSAGMRKLLEAKDCFVRAAIETLHE